MRVKLAEVFVDHDGNLFWSLTGSKMCHKLNFSDLPLSLRGGIKAELEGVLTATSVLLQEIDQE